jgi:cytochrome c oxidase subunit III
MTGDVATLGHDETGIAGQPVVVQGGHAARGISNPILGMLLFITSEVMFFGGLFAAYFSTRAANQTTPAWTNVATLLNPLSVILVATVILITSSFTCQFAVWAIRRGDRTGFIRNISFTLVLGIVFLLLQAYDYTLLFGDGMTLGSSEFGTTYFTLTGFHGAHVFGGVLMLAVILYRGMSGQFSSKHHDAVEAVSFYWHFVDVVWIILFTVLYVL